ncbi:MAG: hypothetical protein ABSE89_11240 [Sedimentisphaerales bacterium]
MDEKNNTLADFSMNAFYLPMQPGYTNAYYNALADLVVVKSCRNNGYDEIFSHEINHRLLAFNPMHCYMRIFASLVYQKMIFLVTSDQGNKKLNVPEYFINEPKLKSCKTIIDSLSKAIEPIQEVSGLCGLKNTFKKMGYPIEELETWEKESIVYSEKRLGIAGFRELSTRFKRVIERLGDWKYVMGVSLYSLSSPLCWPETQDLDVLVNTIGEAVLNDPIFSPRLRLEHLLSIVEECPYIDFPRWAPEEKDIYIRTQLAKRYDHLVKRPFNSAACTPGTDQCYLHLLEKVLDKNLLRCELLKLWQYMCECWQVSMRDGIIAEEDSHKKVQPAAWPSFIWINDDHRYYHSEMDEVKISLLFVESMRQQLLTGQGLYCPTDGYCAGFPECDIFKTLKSLWNKTRVSPDNKRWFNPQCHHCKM